MVVLTILYSIAGLGIAIVNDFKSIEGECVGYIRSQIESCLCHQGGIGWGGVRRKGWDGVVWSPGGHMGCTAWASGRVGAQKLQPPYCCVPACLLAPHPPPLVPPTLPPRRRPGHGAAVAAGGLWSRDGQVDLRQLHRRHAGGGGSPSVGGIRHAPSSGTELARATQSGRGVDQSVTDSRAHRPPPQPHISVLNESPPPPT